MALSVSIQDLARDTGNSSAAVLASALDKAVGTFLSANKNPSRKVKARTPFVGTKRPVGWARIGYYRLLEVVTRPKLSFWRCFMGLCRPMTRL